MAGSMPPIHPVGQTPFPSVPTPTPGAMATPVPGGNGYGTTLGALVNHLQNVTGGGTIPRPPIIPPITGPPTGIDGLPYGFPYNLPDYLRGAY
jgi:hypothetical protein